ncbi:MAG: hypothetical protein RI918_2427 [Pseudomonadota bacterium]
MLLLGFAAGLPILLVLGTLSFRLREAGIDRTTIGFLSWVGLAYGLKWVWSPLVDKMPIPLLTRLLGRRRSWLLLSQFVIVSGLVGMALTNPQNDLKSMVWFAVIVAFASATQDIALDAYRIELADVDRQAALASAYMTGYRIAMIWAGAGVFWVAAFAELAPVAAAAGEVAKVVYQHNAWQTAYLVMAASMVLGVLTVFFSPEPITLNNEAEIKKMAAVKEVFQTKGLVFTWPLASTMIGLGGLLTSLILSALVSSKILVISDSFAQFLLLSAALLFFVGCLGLDRHWGAERPLKTSVHASLAKPLTWLHLAVFLPFADFIRRYRRQALLILALIATYRISDVVMGIMANPFYVDMGYTKLEVANVTKVFGVIMTLVGAFIGGVLSMRFGVMRILMLGAILSAVSNLLFAWLGGRGHDLTALVWVISADNLSSGIASAAFIAYLSSLTNINYSATQYALFSSMMLLLPKFLAGYSGKYVDAFGYIDFFTATAMLGMPVLLLVWLASRIETPEKVI